MSDRAFLADELVWRAAIRTGTPLPNPHDLIEWAPRFATAEGMIRDCATLLLGFPAAPVHPEGRLGSTLAIALAELDGIARALPPEAAPTLAQADPARFTGRPDRIESLRPLARAPDGPADLAAAARQLVDLLGSADQPDLPALADLLASLRGLAARVPALDYRLYADAPLDLLATAIATICLAEFALDTRDLAVPPLGSPALLWRSARCSRTGLGPYLRNVGSLIRLTSDIYDMARGAAAAAGQTDPDHVGAWVELLARGLEDAVLREVADDFADHGLMAPVAAILARTLSHLPAAVDLSTVLRLRDAALDAGDYGLAARAQAAAVGLRPESVLELEILGTIQAANGDLADAEASLRACLTLDPHRDSARARLETLGTRAFAPFLVDRGYGSPDHRADVRLDRRGIPLSYRQMRGERMAAVEVS